MKINKEEMLDLLEEINYNRGCSCCGDSVKCYKAIEELKTMIKDLE